MPTLPPDPVASHQAREVAESFGHDAERYDRVRPSYPAALIERIVASSPGRAGTDVLDVGCGTGILGRQLQGAGCRVLGVDPDPRMAELARRSGLAVEVATFESWDPAGRRFDAVVAGTAWHWVDPVAGADRAARVLRPGGRLVLFWNGFQPQDDLGPLFNTISREQFPDLPMLDWTLPAGRGYDPFLDTAAAGMAAAGFGPDERWQDDWQRSYTRAEWLDVVPTFGGMGRLPAEQLERLLAAMGAAVDAVGGSFAMRYATVSVTAVVGPRA